MAHLAGTSLAKAEQIPVQSISSRTTLSKPIPSRAGMGSAEFGSIIEIPKDSPVLSGVYATPNVYHGELTPLLWQLLAYRAAAQRTKVVKG